MACERESNGFRMLGWVPSTCQLVFLIHTPALDLGLLSGVVVQGRGSGIQGSLGSGPSWAFLALCFGTAADRLGHLSTFVFPTDFWVNGLEVSLPS